MTIFEELVRATSAKSQQAGESDDGYLTNIVVAVSKLPDTQFWKLSAQAQTWFNSAASTITATKQVPDCPGFKEKQKQQEKDKPKPTFKAHIGSGRIQSLVPNVANTPQSKEVKKTGVMDAIRHCVILHPDWTTRKVHQHLKENGWPSVNQNTVAIDGGNIRRVIELAREMGFWRDENYANYKSFESATEGVTVEAETDTTASA